MASFLYPALAALGLNNPQQLQSPSAPSPLAGAWQTATQVSPELGALGTLGQRLGQIGQGEAGRYQQFAANFPQSATQVDPQQMQGLTALGMGAVGGIEAEGLEPWQMTRAEFHQGKNLHGSAIDPAVGKADYDRTGFFTSTEESHANWYANSDVRNPAPGQGDIYAVPPPKKPLDLINNPQGAKPIADTMQQNAQSLYNMYAQGQIKSDPSRFLNAVDELQQHVENNDPRVKNALVNADLEWNRYMTGNPMNWGKGSLSNRLVKQNGFDALITHETNQDTGLPAQVTVYMKRPKDAVSHRQAVVQALKQGKAVPGRVLADYPELTGGTPIARGGPSQGQMSLKFGAKVPQPSTLYPEEGPPTRRGQYQAPSYARMKAGIGRWGKFQEPKTGEAAESPVLPTAPRR